MYQEELLAYFRQQDYEQARNEIRQLQQVRIARTTSARKTSPHITTHFFVLLRAFLTPIRGAQGCCLAATAVPCCA